MRVHRFRPLVLALLVGLTTLCGAVAVAQCDDACEPGCGDCAACPVVAELLVSPDLAPLSRCGDPALADGGAPLPPPIAAPDKVPLAAA